MKESRLYSFMDINKRFTLHFLEGQKLMSDLMLIHNLNSTALDYYRSIILSSLHSLSFIKVGDSIGLYIDSDEPYFRFKIELAENGDFRTLLLPEELEEFPTFLTGKARFVKINPHKNPYTSVISLERTKSDEVLNKIFTQSYQANSHVIVSEDVDQSLMISRLPAQNINQLSGVETLSIEDYQESQASFIEKVINMNFNDFESIVDYFEKDRYAYLGSKQLKLTCSCSKERMISNLHLLPINEKKQLFEKNDSIETRCDYCNSIFIITESDFSS